MNSSTPRHLLHFVTRRLRLRRYLKDPADGLNNPRFRRRLYSGPYWSAKFSGNRVFMQSRRGSRALNILS
jgi:hypothetical protein